MSHASDALSFAQRQIGKPYKWGGQGPNSYDCSGLILASYAAAGLPFPDTTSDRILDAYCDRITLGQTMPGDVIQPHAGHIFMVAVPGGSVIVEAPRTGLNVRQVPRWGAPWKVGRIHGSEAGVVTPVPSAHPTLQLHSTGETVKLWQRVIGATADGFFGPVTSRLTKDWQTRHGLVPDGIVGPRTWAASGV